MGLIAFWGNYQQTHRRPPTPWPVEPVVATERVTAEIIFPFHFGILLPVPVEPGDDDDDCLHIHTQQSRERTERFMHEQTTSCRSSRGCQPAEPFRVPSAKPTRAREIVCQVEEIKFRRINRVFVSRTLPLNPGQQPRTVHLQEKNEVFHPTYVNPSDSEKEAKKKTP